MNEIYEEIEVPEAWRALDIASWHGSVLVVGASDTGKSTFVRYLYARLLENRGRVAFLDADVGQNGYCLPATMVMARNAGPEDATFPPRAARRVWFVGSNAPPGHMLRMVLGVSCLFRSLEADAQVVDTTGFVDLDRGGVNLKWAKIELLRPCTIVAFQREDELRPLLLPLHSLPGVRVVELPVPAAVRERSKAERRAYRAACYRDYFEKAPCLVLDYHGLAVFPARRFRRGRLVALEDADGFARALALVEGKDEDAVHLRTPLPRSQREKIAALRLGDLRIDVGTFQDEYLRV